LSAKHSNCNMQILEKESRFLTAGGHYKESSVSDVFQVNERIWGWWCHKKLTKWLATQVA